MNFIEVEKKFNELSEENYKNKSRKLQEEIVALLEDFLNETNLSVEHKIFAYWNISDNYALQRKYLETFNNHLKFEKFLRSLNNPNYMLMLINDSTQRLALIESGNGLYWSNLYFELINNINITDSNYCIVFEVLRAALYPARFNGYDKVCLHALNTMEELVDKYKNDSEILRFKIIYYSHLLKYKHRNNQSYEDILNESYNIFLELKEYLKYEEELEYVLFGTYESCNKKRSKWHQGRSIHDYIIDLIDINENVLAYKCYLEIGEDEFINIYFINKIKILKERLNL